MRRLLKRSLLIFSSFLFMLNAGLWVGGEYYLLAHKSPQEYPSISPLKVRWTYWSILEGKYEYSHCFQDDTVMSAAESRPRTLLLSDHTKHYFEIPGIDIHRQTLTCVGLISGAFRIEVECWLVALITGIFPILRIIHFFKGVAANRRVQRAGLCKVCRYDLRAHQHGDKCPECGTLIERAAQPH